MGETKHFSAESKARVAREARKPQMGRASGDGMPRRTTTVARHLFDRGALASLERAPAPACHPC